MGDWKTHADGEKVTPTEQDEWVQEKKYALLADRDAASVGWGSAELFRACKVVETGAKYYWNGAAWTEFPATGGAGAPVDATYVTTSADPVLTSEALHKDLAGANLHVTKAHKAEHENAGADEISVAGLSGKLADEQNAGWIKAKSVDAPLAGDDLKFVQYNHGASKFQLASVGGGGDMTKAVYDIGDNGIVDNSEKLENSTKAQVQDHTPKAHKDTHKTAGGDAFTNADALDGIARIQHRKNSGANFSTGRRRINWIEGANVTLTCTDDAANEEVDVNIAFAGGGAVKLSQDYLVYEVGGTWYAMDDDGNIDYSNANPRIVINQGLAAVGGGTYQRKVVVKGDV